MKIKLVILAGGKSSRLFPIFNENYPKQYFLKIGNLTLIEYIITKYLKYLDNIDEIYISINKIHYYFLINSLRKY